MNGADFFDILTEEEVGNWVNNIGGVGRGRLIKLASNCYQTIDEALFDSLISDLVESLAFDNPSSRYTELQGHRPDDNNLEDNNYIRESDLTSAIAGKQDSITPADFIENPEDLSFDDLPTNFTALSVLFTPLNNTNEAVNDIKAKYNDLEAKMETLLAAMRAQGLQNDA